VAQTPLTATEELNIADMQGLVARAYGNLPFARYVFCHIGEPVAARAWLAEVAGEVFTADRSETDDPCLNLALTWEGLRRLGLPEDDLATFPRPLQEGMVTPHRSRALGDFGASDPEKWAWGGPTEGEGVIHVLVMLFAKTEDALDAEHARRRVAYGAGGGLTELGRPIEGRLLASAGQEHFGFFDGLSQPRMKGWPRKQRSVHPDVPADAEAEAAAAEVARFEEVEPGEIVLGYLDNFGKTAEGPTVPRSGLTRDLRDACWAPGRCDLGRNGSFLVFRQLAQDVPAFHAAVREASEATTGRSLPLSTEKVAAKVVGRWASGASLVQSPDSDPGEPGSNGFGYAEHDLNGLRCPIGAHVRRTNPRDSSEDNPEATLDSTRNHRILRRGRPYGRPLPPAASDEVVDEADEERGLLFLCLNTDIERQFEFIQHTWINNPFFAGLNGEIDPLVGAHPAPCGPFTVPDEPVRRQVSGMSGFVSTRGGAYLFLPGVAALRYLSGIPG